MWVRVWAHRIFSKKFTVQGKASYLMRKSRSHSSDSQGRLSGDDSDGLLWDSFTGITFWLYSKRNWGDEKWAVGNCCLWQVKSRDKYSVDVAIKFRTVAWANCNHLCAVLPEGGRDFRRPFYSGGTSTQWPFRSNLGLGPVLFHSLKQHIQTVLCTDLYARGGRFDGERVSALMNFTI